MTPAPIATETLQQIVVMGRGTVERYVPGPDEACISIRSPGESPVALSPAFAAVLRLAFDDVPFHCEELEARTISAADAARVAAFVAEHAPRARRLVVHCTVGASRSPSMARAIAVYGLAAHVDVVRRSGNLEDRGGGITGRIPDRSVFTRVGRALLAHRYPIGTEAAHG